MIVFFNCTPKLRNSYGLCQINFQFGMKCLFLWYEFSENIYSLCKIYKYWQQIAEQQIVTAYLCQHVYRYLIFFRTQNSQNKRNSFVFFVPSVFDKKYRVSAYKN